MAYVIEVPIDAGGRLLVQAAEEDLPADLELAALRPGEVVVRAEESLEAALDQVKPAINAMVGRLRAMSPDEVSIEFGILLGAETGVIVAKGTAEVHFTVSLTWKRGEAGADAT
jgi:Trypsin-co-occurring domain 1